MKSSHRSYTARNELQKLYIHINDDFIPLDEELALPVDEILKPRFPHLTDFHHDRLHLSVEAFRDFLQAHPLLETISQAWRVTPEKKKYDWWGYWKAIRDRPARKTFDIEYEHPFYEYSTSRLRLCTKSRLASDTQYNCVDVLTEELLLEMETWNYLQDKTEWTDELTFGWLLDVA